MHQGGRVCEIPYEIDSIHVAYFALEIETLETLKLNGRMLLILELLL